MFKPIAMIVLVTTASHGSSEGTVVAVVVIVAAVLLALNSIGVLPRGKTADRLKLDLDVSERRVKALEHTNSILEAQPNLDKHAKALEEISSTLRSHDERMMKLNERILSRLDLIEVSVVTRNSRDDK